jgi:branched-chain amino acid transport system substrate-binding protein
MLTGEPEYMDPLKDECPEGWVVTGYPWDQIQTANHRRFREAYQKRFNDYPRLGSVVGYDTVVSIVAMLRKSGGTETEKMVDAMKGLPFESAFALEGGLADIGAQRRLVVDGAKYLPSDDVVRTLRPQG